MNLQVHLQILHPHLLSLPLGLQVLGPHPLPPSLPASATLFLISSYNLASISPPIFSLLPSLHGDPPFSFGEYDPMLASLHSFVFSLSMPRLAPAITLKQHQQTREKNQISIWALQIESNHRIMVGIDHKNGRYRPYL
ncbi:hypothetical protein AAC387_Pa10g1953 [Persea americana]